MTTQYQNEVRSACEELCLALERFSIGGRETLESMTGLRLMISGYYELKRRNARYGCGSLCAGGGPAMAVVFERLV